VKMKPGQTERTFILVKPDGIRRGLTGEILSRFERKGLSIISAQIVVADSELAAAHYQEHQGNDEYFELMKQAILNGPCLAVVLEGHYAVQAARQMIGTANPFQSQVGTIRGDFATKMGENLIHGADSGAAAMREMKLWFKDNLPAVEKKIETMPVSTVGAGKVWAPPKKKQAKKVEAIVDSTPVKPSFEWKVNKILELEPLEPTFVELQEKTGIPSLVEQTHTPEQDSDKKLKPGVTVNTEGKPEITLWPANMPIKLDPTFQKYYTFNSSPDSDWIIENFYDTGEEVEKV
jgi:nucleoside-diphosphate kinase